MIKAIYLGDSIYFNNLSEVKTYYSIPDAACIEDINTALSAEYSGMAAPVLTEMED